MKMENGKPLIPSILLDGMPIVKRKGKCSRVQLHLAAANDAVVQQQHTFRCCCSNCVTNTLMKTRRNYKSFLKLKAQNK